MEDRGFCSTAKRSPPVPQQHSASGIAKRAEVGMNSKSYSKAVAAATGRGFKSHQPDLVFGNPKHNIEFQNKSKVTKIQKRSSNAPNGAC